MVRDNNNPRLSVNKLCEYVTSRASRQRRILKDAKYPDAFITAYYKVASEAISAHIASQSDDLGAIESKIKAISQKPTNTIYAERQNKGNIAALEQYMDLAENIDLKGAIPRLGAHSAEHLRFHGVSVSVRPEVTLHGFNRKKEAIVGGIKLHFPKTFPLDEEKAGYISAAVQLYSRDHLYQEGKSNHTLSFVIDISSGKVFSGAKSIVKKQKDIEAACEQISVLWPKIIK